MAAVDVNTCNARQLSAIPGIQKQLATAIIRWRQEHGQINMMEDLWHVDGMNRSKFQILRRHFYAGEGESGIMQAGETPVGYVRAPSSFMCQGQSVHGDGIRLQTEKSDERSVSPRRSIKHRLTNSGSQYSSCEELKKKSCRSAILTGQSINTPRSSITSSNHVNSKTLSPRRTSLPKGSLLDTTMEQEPPAVEDQVPQRCVTSLGHRAQQQQNLMELKEQVADKPGFVLQPSESGNNINVTCTIDKRLLSNLKGPVAIQLDKSSGPSDKVPLTQDPTLRSIVDKMGKDPQATSDYATGTAHQSSVDSGKIAGEDVPPTYLNLENLLRFDRCHRTTFEQRMDNVSSWVDEVNRSRPETEALSMHNTKQTRETIGKPINLVRPGYLHDLVQQCGPSPVVKVSVEKKCTRGVRPTPTPTKTAINSRDKSSPVTDHMVSGSNSPMSKPLPVNPNDKRHISAVLRHPPMPPTTPRSPSPIKGVVTTITHDRNVLTPPHNAMRYSVHKPEMSKSAKQSRNSTTSKSKGAPSKSQPILSSRKKSSGYNAPAHKSGTHLRSPRSSKNNAQTGSTSPRNKNKQHSLIRRVWDETQGQGQCGTMLRKPLNQPKTASKGSAKGRHFLHQFSFVKPT